LVVLLCMQFPHVLGRQSAAEAPGLSLCAGSAAKLSLAEEMAVLVLPGLLPAGKVEHPLLLVSCIALEAALNLSTALYNSQSIALSAAVVYNWFLCPWRDCPQQQCCMECVRGHEQAFCLFSKVQRCSPFAA
jgi:hypothetical protein